MAHHDLRHDKECLNCGYIVDRKYCSECGQMNTETRQSFVHLLAHFAEDLTHYDGAFWKSIKHLLFRPGKLTIEYLLGHRMRYVPPVKLYIFISFIAFFLMAVMAPDAEENPHKSGHDNKITKGVNLSKKEEGSHTYYSIRELDSIQNSLPEDKKMHFTEYYATKAILKAKSQDFTLRDFIIVTAHTIPKVLFIYMPIFAFLLWLIHGKRRWYFFDHSIFTLHYFSFLLLLVTINLLISWVVYSTLHIDISDPISLMFFMASLIYSFFYFFRSHRRFYGETRFMSRFKSSILFFINAFLLLIICLVTMVYITLHIH